MKIVKAWKDAAGFYYVVEMAAGEPQQHFRWGAVPDDFAEEDWLAMHEKEMMGFAIAPAAAAADTAEPLPIEGRVFEAAELAELAEESGAAVLKGEATPRSFGAGSSGVRGLTGEQSGDNAPDAIRPHNPKKHRR